MRASALAVVLLLLLLAASCRASNDAPPPPEAESRARASKQRLRYLELMATLPRFEAEQRAWPRPLTLECQEKGRRRVAEIEAIRVELADVAGPYATTTAALDACMELEKCAACDDSSDVAHCATARDLLDQARGDWVRAQHP